MANFLFLTEINELWFGKYCTYLSDDTRGWIVCGIPALGVWANYLSSSEDLHQAAQKQPGLHLRF